MRRLMWFTIGYALSCGVGVYLLRDSRLLLMAAALGVLSLLGLHFRRHPVGKRLLAVFLGGILGCLAFFTSL